MDKYQSESVALGLLFMGGYFTRLPAGMHREDSEKRALAQTASKAQECAVLCGQKVLPA